MSSGVVFDHPGVLDTLALSYGGPESVAGIRKIIPTAPPHTTMRVNPLVSNAVEAVRSCTDLDSYSLVECPHGIPNSLSIIPKVTTASTPVIDGDVDSLPLVILGVRCGEAVLRGADVFAPGVLSASKGILPGDKVKMVADVHTQLLIGEDPANLKVGVFIGVGEAQLKRKEMLDGETRQGKVAVKPLLLVTPDGTPLGYKMPSMHTLQHQDGAVVLQNVPSMLAGLALEVGGGEEPLHVLDMCAAPGGKTTHIAQQMMTARGGGSTGGEGGGSASPYLSRCRLVACDRSRTRAAEVVSLCGKLGIPARSGLKEEGGDGSSTCSQFAVEVLGGTDSRNLGKYFKEGGLFDRVLLDAPCSGVGLRPRLHESITELDFKTCAEFQKKLLKEAVRLVKPGGLIVYSTCSMNPDEGEGVVAHAVNEFADAIELVDVWRHQRAATNKQQTDTETTSSSSSTVAIKDSQGAHFTKLGGCGLDVHGLSLEQRRMVRRFTPWGDEDKRLEQEGGDFSAFFIAKFYKRLTPCVTL